MTAIILVGGKGTRIASIVSDVPKPLVPVAGRPFLHWVLDWVALQGETRLVLAAQHLSEQVLAFAERESTDRSGVSISVCVEPEPLGTGGAVTLAASRHPDGTYLVLNGDSVALFSLAAAYEWLASDPTLDGVVAGVDIDDAARYGSLDVDDRSILRGFSEKRPGAGLINAGIYLFRARLLASLASGRLSMETDCFPRWLAAGARLGVVVAKAPFIDIGTPQSLSESSRFVQENKDMLAAAGQMPVARPVVREVN